MVIARAFERQSAAIVQIQYLAPKPRLSIRDYEWLRTKSELQSGSQAVSVWNILIGLSHNRNDPAPSSPLKPSHWPAKYMHAGFFVHENLLLPPESDPPLRANHKPPLRWNRDPLGRN
jgi:hypothetical protein